ncbi:thiamine pyrophosphate-dependent enzyme [Lentzea sp. NPDC051838]|uniref:thiamine pyrophosphate-dependent enzyme n=1 Tax=Lentzea sp. NPDC051838 TaxID=3154849 RepID=UPI0034412034
MKDASFEVLRRFRLTTLFANPGSTEVSLLAGLPSDVDFVLGLHEASVIGMATGYALRTDRPALALLHTTAGLGNAVGALATARANRAPLVVVVGQQDRRHLATEPFLAGRLHGLAGDYPVWEHQPERPQDVPGALARAWHEARDGRGPALVIVPMDDWDAEADPDALIAPSTLHQGRRVDDVALAEVAALLEGATSPVVVAGAGNDSPAGWAALTELAERLDCPVWQEAFGARAGFPQDHWLFAGHLPASRSGLRKVLSGHDVVLTVGAPAFRQYPYESGAFVEPGTRIAVITDDPEEAHRSPAEVAVLGDPAETVERLARRLSRFLGPVREAIERPRPPLPGPGEPLRAKHVLDALAQRLPHDTVLLEETPSSRPDLHALVPARAPLGFLSAAMGGLGFALPAAIGVRLAGPDRPVVAVLGDGASLYSIQALWSARHYGVGALFVVLANGRYAIMDRLSEQAGAAAPAWPPFTEVSVTALARGFGCPADRVDDLPGLLAALDAVLPTLAERQEPLLLEVVVEPDAHYRA